MKAILCNLCVVDLHIVNNGFGSIGGVGLFAVGGPRSPHPAVPFQWLRPWHACECLDFVRIRTLISAYVNKCHLSALFRYVTTSLWDLQDLLTSSVLMLPNAEKTEDGHKAAQLPRRAMGSPLQVYYLPFKTFGRQKECSCLVKLYSSFCSSTYWFMTPGGELCHKIVNLWFIWHWSVCYAKPDQSPSSLTFSTSLHLYFLSFSLSQQLSTWEQVLCGKTEEQTMPSEATHKYLSNYSSRALVM